MYIVPLNSEITPLKIFSQVENTDKNTAEALSEKVPSFADVFREVMKDMTDTQQVVNEDALKLALGEIDDLHTIYNDMTKASIAVETFVAIKNAAQQSYDQIMQMQM